MSLAALGSAATPAIEEALDSIEKEGVQSRLYRATFWLSLAHAKIRGPDAFPMLGVGGWDALRAESSAAMRQVYATAS